MKPYCVVRWDDKVARYSLLLSPLEVTGARCGSPVCIPPLIRYGLVKSLLCRPECLFSIVCVLLICWYVWQYLSALSLCVMLSWRKKKKSYRRHGDQSQGEKLNEAESHTDSFFFFFPPPLSHAHLQFDASFVQQKKAQSRIIRAVCLANVALFQDDLIAKGRRLIDLAPPQPPPPRPNCLVAHWLVKNNLTFWKSDTHPKRVRGFFFLSLNDIIVLGVWKIRLTHAIKPRLF